MYLAKTPAASKYNDPSQHSKVTLETEPSDDMVRLTVTQDGLEPGSSMDKGRDVGLIRSPQIRISDPPEGLWFSKPHRNRQMMA